MEMRISGKHMSVTEGMRGHMREKLDKLNRYTPRIIEAHVVIKKEKYIYYAEVTVLAKNLRAYGEGRAKDNVYTAMDVASDRVEKQLKKYREKVKNHRTKRDKTFFATEESKAGRSSADETEALDEEIPEVIPQKVQNIKPMTTEEASLQLALSRQSFLIFSNAVTRKINVLFKREDGNHGLIEPGL